MACNIKIKPTLYLVYDYDLEEANLNAMSLKGWQLKKGGLFHHTYERNDQCYRYKLDFNNKVNINSEEFDRFLSIFEEQGWELVNSTINGWHYFRKKYDPSLPEEAYEIYTDDTSLLVMLNRWIKIARFLQAFCLVLLILYLTLYIIEHDQKLLIEAGMIGLGLALLEFSIWNLKNKKAGSKPDISKRKFGGYLLSTGYLLSFLLVIYFAFYEPEIHEMKATAQINQDTPDYIDKLVVKKNGEYLIDLKCKTERGALSVCILNKDTLIYKKTGADFTISNSKLYLKKGIYTIKIVYHLKDYQKVLHADQKELENYHLTGDLNKMSNVNISIIIKRSLF